MAKKKIYNLKINTIKIVGFFFLFFLCFFKESKLSFEQNNHPTSQSALFEFSAKNFPKSILLFDNLITAKLEQNPEKYSKTLLDLERNRDYFSKNQLPTTSFSLALAISTLQNIVLDEKDENNLLSYSLSKDSKSSLPLVAFQTTKLERWLKNTLLAKNKYTLQTKDIQWISLTLNRIVLALNNIPVTEKIFRNRLLARACWAVLFGLWQSHGEISIRESAILNPLLRTIIEKIPIPDRNLLEQTLMEIELFQSEEGEDLTEITKARITNIELLQNYSHFLCNPQEGTIINEYMLQTLFLMETTKIKKFDFTKVLKNCFVGHRNFLPPIPAFYRFNRVNPIGFYIPATADLKPWLQYYKNVLTHNTLNNSIPAIDEIATMGWKLQIGWPISNAITPKILEKTCGPNLYENRILCANLQWLSCANATEKTAFLKKYKDILPMDILHNLAIKSLTDLLTQQQSLAANEKNNDSLKRLYKDFSQYLKTNFPEYDTIIWYYQNHGIILK